MSVEIKNKNKPKRKSFRIWLINLLVGDSSYMQNVGINVDTRKLLLRKDHFLIGCGFHGDFTVEFSDRTMKEFIDDSKCN